MISETKIVKSFTKGNFLKGFNTPHRSDRDSKGG